MASSGLWMGKPHERLDAWKFAMRLGGCPKIESLLRESPFSPFSRSFSLNMNNYSPQMTEKMDSKWLSLATASILGQPPSESSV